MLLLYLVDVALTADNPKKPYAVENMNPAVDGVTPIPACESDAFARTPCWDFFYTPNTSALVRVRGCVPACGGACGGGDLVWLLLPACVPVGRVRCLHTSLPSPTCRTPLFPP